MPQKKDPAPIDFVVTWVDGSAPAWQAMRREYMDLLSDDNKAGNSEARYRDMGLLRYWFRGVEKFAPWVHKIYFITCGQRPGWLNIQHPKLQLVDHRDYLPLENLPTFNSNAIELGMHRIQGLAEQFVYFNDDVFLTAPVEPKTFFRGSLPCDMYEFKALASFMNGDGIDYTRLNDLGIINRHFFGRKSKLEKAYKKYNCAYPLKILVRNVFSLGWRGYLGFDDPHIALAYRKEDFEKVWKAEPELLQTTAAHRFRTPYDLNHWVFRYWRLVEGEFSPVDLHSYAKCFHLGHDNTVPVQTIRSQTYKILCLNDTANNVDFDATKRNLEQAFLAILPDKSEFEL